ncbi:hypothetical protein D3C81_2057980 [compost metagenome]
MMPWRPAQTIGMAVADGMPCRTEGYIGTGHNSVIRALMDRRGQVGHVEPDLTDDIRRVMVHFRSFEVRRQDVLQIGLNF